MKSDNVCWLATASISSSIEIGPAQVLAKKAGIAILWNKLRLLRHCDIINTCHNGNPLIFQVAEIIRDSSGSLAGEVMMCHIVGDNLKGKLPPLHFHVFQVEMKSKKLL